MNRNSVGSLLLAGALIAFGGRAGAAGVPAIPTGDGMGAIESFDAARGTVILGRQTVALLPGVASSLQQQLAVQGRAFGSPFMAKFSVGRDAVGKPVIESIYVMPPKRAKGAQ